MLKELSWKNKLFAITLGTILTVVSPIKVILGIILITGIIILWTIEKF